MGYYAEFLKVIEGYDVAIYPFYANGLLITAGVIAAVLAYFIVLVKCIDACRSLSNVWRYVMPTLVTLIFVAYIVGLTKTSYTVSNHLRAIEQSRIDTLYSITTKTMELEERSIAKLVKKKDYTPALGKITRENVNFNGVAFKNATVYVISNENHKQGVLYQVSDATRDSYFGEAPELPSYKFYDLLDNDLLGAQLYAEEVTRSPDGLYIPLYEVDFILNIAGSE